MTEVKGDPCGHCGYKKPLLKQLKDGRWSVVCNCGMNTGPCKTPERALSRWNTRVACRCNDNRREW